MLRILEVRETSAKPFSKMISAKEIEKYLLNLPKEVVCEAFSHVLYQLFQNDVIVGTGRFEGDMSEVMKLDFSLLIKKQKERD